MAINHAALAAEINGDPQTYGYAGDVAAGNDQAVADKLNKPRDGTDGEAAVSVRRPDISAAELLEAVDTRDFPASPNPLAVAWFESVTQYPTLRLVADDGTPTRVKGNLDRILANTQGSQTRLNALAVRVGSRAEQLFGFGTHVTAFDVAKALGRG